MSSKKWVKELKEEQQKREEEMKQYDNVCLNTLVNLRRNLKGYGLRGKLRIIKENIKYAWQRAWRGYDDLAIYNYDTWFPAISMEVLKDLYIINKAAWMKPNDEMKDHNDICYTYEETQYKIKNIVMLLNIINDIDAESDKFYWAQNEFLSQMDKYWNDLWF